MRLTKKLGNVYINNIPNKEKLDFEERKNESIRITNSIYEKFGRIEDIETELGIDLITYFKLINAENVYSYGHTNIMKNTGQVNIYDRTITIWNGSCHQIYPLSEYGKSFALTKEELEK